MKKHKIIAHSKYDALEKLKNTNKEQIDSIKLAVLSGATSGLSVLINSTTPEQAELILNLIAIVAGVICLMTSGFAIADGIEKKQLKNYIKQVEEQEQQQKE